VERMAEPGAVDESLEIMPGFAKQLVTATDKLLREISDRLEPALTVDKAVNDVIEQIRPPFPESGPRK
jgi:hypothetical protein